MHCLDKIMEGIKCTTEEKFHAKAQRRSAKAAKKSIEPQGRRRGRKAVRVLLVGVLAPASAGVCLDWKLRVAGAGVRLCRSGWKRPLPAVRLTPTSK